MTEHFELRDEEFISKPPPSSEAASGFNPEKEEEYNPNKRVYGVFLDKAVPGQVIIARTKNNTYRIEKRSDGFYISGHPKHCPEPVRALIVQNGDSKEKDLISSGNHLSVTLENGRFTTTTLQNVYFEKPAKNKKQENSVQDERPTEFVE